MDNLLHELAKHVPDCSNYLCGYSAEALLQYLTLQNQNIQNIPNVLVMLHSEMMSLIPKHFGGRSVSDYQKPPAAYLQEAAVTLLNKLKMDTSLFDTDRFQSWYETVFSPSIDVIKRSSKQERVLIQKKHWFLRKLEYKYLNVVGGWLRPKAIRSILLGTGVVR